RMPVMGGYEMLQSLRGTMKLELPVPVLTGYASLGSMFKCATLGINGYLAKPFRLEDLETKVAALLQGPVGRVPTLAPEARERLSPREQEVLLLMRQGETDASIAAKLYISPNTAHNHVKRIMSKL